MKNSIEELEPLMGTLNGRAIYDFYCQECETFGHDTVSFSTFMRRLKHYRATSTYRPANPSARVVEYQLSKDLLNRFLDKLLKTPKRFRGAEQAYEHYLKLVQDTADDSVGAFSKQYVFRLLKERRLGKKSLPQIGRVKGA